MESWENVWSGTEARRLWSVPDPAVTTLAEMLQSRGQIQRFLDLGCGLGRHTRLLALLGFEVHGIDPSPAAID
ncbi:MAG: class I SAM-dependent methyltransferase [Acidobacteria bacterium]|nr:class I SAM-dependent methyltransferase [Acidobacteriota bacterium]